MISEPVGLVSKQSHSQPTLSRSRMNMQTPAVHVSHAVVSTWIRVWLRLVSISLGHTLLVGRWSCSVPNGAYVAVQHRGRTRYWKLGLTLVSYSLLQTVLARTYRFATIQNVTDDRVTDNRRQTNRQTTRCTKGATDSMVGQKSSKWEIHFTSEVTPDFSKWNFIGHGYTASLDQYD